MEMDQSSLTHADVVGCDEVSLGRVDEIYLDRTSGDPQWVRLDQAAKVVPLVGASFDGQGRLTVPYDETTVRSAPDVAAEGGLLREEQEADLAQHYGMDYRGPGGQPILPGVPTADRSEPSDQTGGEAV